jgi:sortase B
LYGNLYFDEKDHGIEFFAFLHADAYDTLIYTPGINEKDRQAYLDNLIANATHLRDVGVTTDDQLILLSTCSPDSTNGRDILVGRMTDEVFEDTFLNMNTNDLMKGMNGVVKEINLLNILLAILLIILIIVIYYRHRAKGSNEKQDRS